MPIVLLVSPFPRVNDLSRTLIFFHTQLLHRACNKSRHQSVRLLLEYGAEAHCADDSGKTPLHDLCWMGSVYSEGADESALALLEHVSRLYNRRTDLRPHRPLSLAPLLLLLLRTPRYCGPRIDSGSLPWTTFAEIRSRSGSVCCVPTLTNCGPEKAPQAAA